MIKRILFCVLFISISFSQNYADAIKTQAKIVADSFTNGQYEELMKYTYPSLINVMGGKEKFLQTLKGMKSQMEMSGITMEKYEIGEPTQTVNAGKEIHCLVPQKLTMKMPQGKMITEGHLIAISKDNGNHWFFLDTSTVNIQMLKQILPNYNDELVIPPKKQPQFLAE